MTDRVGIDFFSADNVTTTSSVFTLLGGKYGVMVEGDFTGTPNIALQGKAASGTYVTVLTPFTADGYASVDLPAGQYKFTLVSGTLAAGYLTISPIPTAKS